MTVDYSDLNGLEVLLLLLTSRDGIFLWVIMGVAVAITILSFYLDKNDEVSKHIDPTDQRTNM
tara:strand:+ start:161 stop:349 length:189 start_codon:yes stop_codon:yes gene_type:complete